MAGLYNVLYPNTYPSRVGLDGGLNTKFDPDAIDDNETPDCQNVVFGLSNARTRYGTTNLNTTPVKTLACDGLFTRHDSNGSETMVAWYGGTLYALSGSTFTSITSSETIFSAGKAVGAAEYENYMFFGDGSNIPHKWNGAEFTRHGVYPSTTTMVAASGAAGLLNGAYSWKLAYVNSNLVESDVGPVSNSITIASGQAVISSIPVPPQSFGINTKYLYRTKTSGGEYFYVASMPASSTTFTDTIADGSLTTSAPDDQSVPPNYGQIVTHQSRLFAIDRTLNSSGQPNNWVVYSEIGNPYVFKAANFIRLGDKTGDIPKVLAVYDNNIYVGCAKSHWLIYMPSADETTWTPIKIRLQGGSYSNFAPFNFSNKLMIAVADAGKFIGFAALEGTSVFVDRALVTNNTSGSDFVSNKIQPNMFKISEAESVSINAMVYQNRAYISVRETESYNDKIYLFDFSIENLSKNQKYTWAPWKGLNIASWTIYNSKLYGAQSTTDGYVIEMEKTDQYYDDINGTKTAIDSYYITKDFLGIKGHDYYWKDFRWLNIKYATSLESIFMSVFTAVNQQEFGGYKDLNTITGGTKWEDLVWSVSTWGNTQTDKDERFSLGSSSGKSLKLKFTNKNTVGYYFNISGISFLYNIKGRR